eukprot:3551906-Pleurochrysis_carterae.AAC.1
MTQCGSSSPARAPPWTLVSNCSRVPPVPAGQLELHPVLSSYPQLVGCCRGFEAPAATLRM